MTATPDIIDRVRKMLAIANNEGATEEEASTAMSMATAMMAKYGIEHAQLAASEARSKETVSTSPIIDRCVLRDDFELWIYHCVNAAARLYASTAFYYKLGDNADYHVVGSEMNVAVAELMVPYLKACVEREYKKALPRGMSKKDRANFRRTFKYACAARLASRASQIVADLQKNDAGASATGSRALVVADYFQTEAKRVAVWMEQQGFQLKSRSRGTSAGLGTAAGLRAAGNINLDRQVGGASTRQLN